MSDGRQVALASATGRCVLAIAVAGSAMVFLDSTVVNVALPDIGRSLGASTSTLQWVLNGYLLTLASLILLGGSLGDRFGRRRIFVYGAAVFSAASLLCALAPDAPLLIVARLLQGVGGALLTPGSLAMIEATFQKDDRSRAIGAWSGLTGVAAAVGPLLGGYLVQAVSWRAIFLINLPLGLFVIVMASYHVPETRDASVAGNAIDWKGAVLTGLGLGGTTYALIEGPTRGGLRAHPGRRDRGRPGVGALLRGRGTIRAPDAAPRHLRLAPVQRGQRRHLRGLHGARGLLLPPGRLPPDLARLLADRGRCSLPAGHLPDAPPVGPRRRPRPADRAEDPPHGRPARDRGRARCS